MKKKFFWRCSCSESDFTLNAVRVRCQLKANAFQRIRCSIKATSKASRLSFSSRSGNEQTNPLGFLRTTTIALHKQELGFLHHYYTSSELSG